jgi:hypothetical protein
MNAQKNQTVSVAVDSFVVVYGDTFNFNQKMKLQYGFKFDFDRKFWYRGILADKFWYWDQTLKGMAGEAKVEVAFLKNLADFSKMKQEVQAIEKEMKALEPVPAHHLDGAIMEVTKWYAGVFKEKNNTQFAYRNLRVIKVFRETQNAYLVDAEFFSGIASACGVCGRQLDNDISRATGIGPICAEKLGMKRPTMETAKEVVKHLESMSKAQGVFTQQWIPKSQIKNTIK